MKLFFKLILGAFVVLSTLTFLGIGAGFWWSYHNFTKPNSVSKPITITVPKGANINQVAQTLNEKSIIEGQASTYIFSYAGRITGQASKIKAGEFEIPPNISMRDILDLLEEGKTVQRNVTIREGLTSFEIVNLLSNVEELKQTDIALPAEGSLLAETYSYSKGESTKDILTRMSTAMDSTLSALWEKRTNNLPITTKEEAIILASIVEKETAQADERATVAGVFINRLRKNMLLQTDPTVIYALTKGKPKNDGKGPLGRRLLYKDLKIDSPYNTYLYPGLPPGPIANPGRAAIEAVLNPEDHDYLYFVADGTGGHAFAKTLKEHNRNVGKWRKIRKAQK